MNGEWTCLLIYSLCALIFVPYNFGYTFIKKYREHSPDLLIGSLKPLFFMLNFGCHQAGHRCEATIEMFFKEVVNFLWRL
jgi:hypothetical protein